MPVSANLLNLGSQASDLSLEGTDGRIYSLDSFKSSDILVIIFMCNHCPYVKAVMARFVKLKDKYKDRGVEFVGINSNDPSVYPEDSFDNMKKFYSHYNMNFPYLVDGSQDVAKAYDAVCTPDIYVYDKDRILKYRGRLDDSWKDEDKVTSQELDKAISLLIEGKELSLEQIPSMGCSIKWKN